MVHSRIIQTKCMVHSRKIKLDKVHGVFSKHSTKAHGVLQCSRKVRQCMVPSRKKKTYTEYILHSTFFSQMMVHCRKNNTACMGHCRIIQTKCMMHCRKVQKKCTICSRRIQTKHMACSCALEKFRHSTRRIPEKHTQSICCVIEKKITKCMVRCKTKYTNCMVHLRRIQTKCMVHWRKKNWTNFMVCSRSIQAKHMACCSVLEKVRQCMVPSRKKTPKSMLHSRIFFTNDVEYCRKIIQLAWCILE